MPHLETWNKLPHAIRQHLMDRMQDRRISIADLNKLRIWVESHPVVPGASGTRISDLSKSAVRDNIRRHSCFLVSPPRAKACERRVARRVTGDVAHRRATLCASPREFRNLKVKLLP